MQQQVTFTVMEAKVQSVRMTKQAKERQDKLLAEGKCLGCERTLAQNETTRRGQCSSCYGKFYYRLDKGQYTEADYIRKGYWLPKDAGGRPPEGEISRKLAEGTI